MTNLTRSQFQAHPFHLVSPSPWPLNTSFCLLATAFSAVLSFQGFEKGVNLLFISLISVIYCMSLWFRDVISEGINLNFLKSLLSNYNSSKVISSQEILNILKNSKYNTNIKEDQLGYYLAGLLEGDGHLSLPFLGKTILNRVLNPRIVFTSHVNDIVLYAYIQSKLGGIGRFQLIGNNKIRYIIGDIKGIVTIINLIKNKLRTPKNYSLNKLIEFINNKYKLNISESFIDKSDLSTNSWLTGFTEADGHFGVVFTEFKPKSLSCKRSSSAKVNLKFVINQRLHDEVTSLSLLSIMQEIAKFLSCNLNSYFTKQNKEFLCINISAIEKLKFVIDYFNKYPLAGIKNENFKDWVKIYDIIISNQHTTPLGRTNIKLIQSNMNSKRQLKSHLTTNMLKSELSYLYIIMLAFIIFGINEFDLNSIMCVNNYIHMI
jgi:LAGLIDADG DNA endonuclease family protein/cytochrome c oxidase subunit III